MSWGPLQILLVLLIVVLLFGTKKLRNLGADLGSSIKSFRKSMSDGEGEDKKMSDTTERKTPTDEDDTR